MWQSSNPTFYGDLTEPQSLNKYQYCYNNPLAYVDPNGHQIRKRLEEAAATYVALEKGRVEGAASVVSGTLTFAWHALTSPSAALEDIKGGVESAKETLKTDLEIVKHPIEAAKAVNDAINENPQQAARIIGNAEGQVGATIALGKGAKALGNAVEGGTGLTTPSKYFGNLTKAQAENVLTNKLGAARSVRPAAKIITIPERDGLSMFMKNQAIKVASRMLTYADEGPVLNGNIP